MGLFVLAKKHLEATAKKVDKNIQVTNRVDQGGAGRRVDIFTLPNSNRVFYDLDDSDRLVKKPWRDPTDLGFQGNPKVISRRRVARVELTFRVIFTNTKPESLENDFYKFMEFLQREIYDGMKANYLDENGIAQVDDKGNIIRIEPQTYDMNDNKFYGNITDKIILDILFRGAIYEDDVSDRITFNTEDINNTLTGQTA